MIENTRQFPISLTLRVGYFLYESIPKQWKKLDIDLRSATIGFAAALIGFSLLCPMFIEDAPLNQWIAWTMVIGLSIRLVAEQTTPQRLHVPSKKQRHHHSRQVLERANQQLWDVLQKQTIAKQHLQATNQNLLRLATTDGLTQVKNRYFFDQEIYHEWTRSQREAQPLSLILFDVDYFKQYNDCYGHQAGDACLQEIAHIAQKSIHRPADFVARYGGEEFAIVLPNTSQEGAIAIAQRIQESLQTLAIPHLQSDVSNIISISLGIASTIPTEDNACDDLIALADQSLYHAKRNGRDRYVIAQ